MNEQKESKGTETSRMTAAGSSFEKSFLSRGLKEQIQNCEHYELVPCFEKWLPDSQPILEAGCGSGRWVGWFAQKGWEAAGLDWSEDCCARARKELQGYRFVAGDMRDMPFEDNAFGSIVSLGAIEHSAEGPFRSLSEYYRVLRRGGIAIITVPYLGIARKVYRLFNWPIKRLKYNKTIRKISGKQAGERSLKLARQETMNGYAADYLYAESGVEFYQYIFTKKQMRAFLNTANLQIVDEFVEFKDEGIYHNFGKLAGSFNYKEGIVEFNIIGKILRSLMPLDKVGHMLCYVVQKQ